MESQPSPVSEKLKFGPELAISIAMSFPLWYPGETRQGDKLEVLQSKIRGDAALETFREATQMGCQIVAVDYKSSSEFLDEVAKLGIKVEEQREDGYSAGRRQSYETASKHPGVKVILSTEAEKPSMLTCLSPEAIRLITDGEADVVIFKRSEESWRSVPREQRDTEQRGVRLWNQILRVHGLLDPDAEDLDVWFGPRLIRNDPSILELFKRRYAFEVRGSKKDLKLDHSLVPDEWVNALFFPVIASLQAKARVRSFTVPYQHPEAQTTMEEGNSEFIKKRKVQYRNVIALTIHYIRMLKKDNQKGRLSEI